MVTKQFSIFSILPIFLISVKRNKTVENDFLIDNIEIFGIIEKVEKVLDRLENICYTWQFFGSKKDSIFVEKC